MTICTQRLHPIFTTLPTPETTFAGFNFPKWAWTLPRRRGTVRQRLNDYRKPVTGPYFTGANKPVPKGRSFYLGDHGAPGLRWEWADKIAQSIQHTGWYTDEDGVGETIRGLVFNLPQGRGFLAGWSMGEGMASAVDYYIYDDELSAALAADDYARDAAEKEREYQAPINSELEEVVS